MNAFLVLVYIAAMITANLLVFWLGPWFSPINALLLIGLDLTLRDVMHERFTKWQLAGVICIGAGLTWGINPAAAHIAAASAAAFFASAAADWAVYAAVKSRPWLVRANASNAVGAAVDSVIFPTLAFGVFLPHIIALQFAAKFFGGAAWAFILDRLLGMDAVVGRMRMQTARARSEARMHALAPEVEDFIVEN